MFAEIITIGDEILIGQILDSNSKFIAEELNKIGVSVYQITSIQDSKEHILQAIRQAEKQSDIIILTGGLGPTNDDITKNVLTEYFEDKLVKNTEIEKHIIALFKKINYQYTNLDLDQAVLPEKALIFKNHFGTASGMWFEKNDKVLVSLPGVPVEMKNLLQKDVLKKIQKSYNLPFILHHTLVTYGEGESRIAKRLVQFETELPKEIKLAYLPAYGTTRLRLTAKGTDLKSLKLLLKEQILKLEILVKDLLFSSNNDLPIEKEIGNLLVEKSKTLATAESCTGGNIAKMLTSIAGSSRYFVGSVVSYNLRVKTEILSVSKQTIDDFSVVSVEVAVEMAENCRKLLQTDYAISVTGNAGPTTDKTDKTVGVVFIAIASKNKTIVKEYNFGQPRERVIEKASITALQMLKNSMI